MMQEHPLPVAMALTQEVIEEGMQRHEASELGLKCQKTGQNNLIKMLGYGTPFFNTLAASHDKQ
jgi:hypothetical protein